MTLFSQAIPLVDLTSVSEARRAVQQVAGKLGLDETRSGQAAVIVTEAARNAVVHGKGGQLLVSGVSQNGEVRMEVVAVDKGPGITDLHRAMHDGYSTSATPGTGLGAIRRMSGSFEVFSTSKGSAVFAQVVGQAHAPAPLLDVAGFAVPMDGELACGDALAWSFSADRLAALAVDGLGHGLAAAEAADEAVRIFEKYSSEVPGEILARIHDALKKTRGAAAAIAEIRPLVGTITFAGIGNISASIVSQTLSRNLVSHSGTLGHVMARVQEFKVEWPRDAVLVMHSDGLQTRWDLSRYPGLAARNPALIAGVLFRDFRRGNDDASVLVVKNRNSAV